MSMNARLHGDCARGWVGVHVNPGVVQNAVEMPTGWGSWACPGNVRPDEVVEKPQLLKSSSVVLMKLLGNKKMGIVTFIAMSS